MVQVNSDLANHSLRSLGFDTSEAFIRALKGAQDPIKSDRLQSRTGFAKIDLAILAWDKYNHVSLEENGASSSSSLVIPRLPQLLLAWLLDALSNAAKAVANLASPTLPESSPLAQPAYYSLLADILAYLPIDPSSLASLSPRSTPQTLLLVTTSLFRLDLQSARRCLPLAAGPVGALIRPHLVMLTSNQTTRTNIDELLELACRRGTELTVEDGSLASAMASLLEVVQGSWLETALETPQLGILSYQTFLDTTLLPWADSVHHLDQLVLQDERIVSLVSVLWRIAEETLFGPAGLRSALSPPADNANPSNFAQTLATRRSPSSSHVLPRLLSSALKRSKRHTQELGAALRGNIGNTTKMESEEPAEAGSILAESLLRCIVRPSLQLVSAEAKLQKEPQRLRTGARARSQILERILQHRLSAHAPALTWTAVVQEVVQTVQSDLADCRDSSALASTLESIRLLWQLDELIVRDNLDGILRTIFARQVEDGAVKLSLQGLLEDLLSSFSRVQELPDLLKSLQTHFSTSTSDLYGDKSAIDPNWLNHALNVAVKSRLPPTQIVDVLSSISQQVSSAVASGSASRRDTSPSSTKKRAHDVSDEQDNAHLRHLRVSNLLRLAQPVLSALSIPSALTTEASPHFDTLTSALQSLVLDGLRKDDRKKPRRSNADSVAATSRPSGTRMATAALWCWYGAAVGQQFSSVTNGEEDNSERHLAKLDAIWPELMSAFPPSRGRDDDEVGLLRIEVVRLMLLQQERSVSLGRPNGLSQLSSDRQAFWNNTVDTLCDDRVQNDTSSALWEMLARRWLLALEAFCSEANLLVLATLLIRTLAPTYGNPARQAASLIVVQNADFYEMKRWRSAMLEALKRGSEGNPSEVLATLSVLSHFPTQYLPSQRRNALLSLAIQSIDSREPSWMLPAHIAIRRWLQNSLQREQSLNDQTAAAMVSALTKLAPCLSNGNQELAIIDSMLFQTAFKKLIDNQKITREEIDRLVKKCAKHDSVLVQMVEILVDSDESRAAKEVNLPAFSLDQINAAHIATNASVSELATTFGRIRLALRLAASQGKDDGLLRLTAEACVVQFCSTAFSSKLRSLVNTSSEEHTSEILTALTSLMTVCARMTDSPQVSIRFPLMFSSVVTACRQGPDVVLPTKVQLGYTSFSICLSTQAYNTSLGTLMTAIESTPIQELGPLVTTMGLALRQGPEGTLVISQKAFTALARRMEAVLTKPGQGAASNALLRYCLGAIHDVSSARAMLFRAVDAGLLISILSYAIAPSGDAQERSQSGHSVSSPHEILSLIVATLKNLIRLRRDLFVPIIPQLAALLAQLPPLFRASLPQASNSQRLRLNALLPTWLDVTTDKPRILGAAEAREVARLFETLTAKSAASLPQGHRYDPMTHRVKQGKTRKSPSSVDSLARPFSKHAIYVVISYVQSLLAPHGSFIPAHIKRELLPGLVSLCGIVSNETIERDWVLASGDFLDQGGKTVFKEEVWKEYERTKYRGD